MRKTPCVYTITDDLKMIVCCYFRVRYPLKYSELLLRTEQQEETSAKVHRIKSFWKNNMVGTEFENLGSKSSTRDLDFVPGQKLFRAPPHRYQGLPRTFWSSACHKYGYPVWNFIILITSWYFSGPKFSVFYENITHNFVTEGSLPTKIGTWVQ